MCPVESSPSNNPAYANATLKIISAIHELEDVIPSDKHYLLEQLQEWYSEQNMIELEAAFEQGFRLGAQLMMAIQESDISVEIIAGEKDGR
ncbi:DUF6809 family protein [Oscillospiraceae bacterium LTW-04]